MSKLDEHASYHFDWCGLTEKCTCGASEAVKELVDLRTRLKRYENALREIKKGEGAFSRDPFMHAVNTLENMKAIATKALDEPDE